MQMSLFVPLELRAQLKAIAAAEHRTLSNLVCLLISIGLNQWSQSATNLDPS